MIKGYAVAVIVGAVLAAPSGAQAGFGLVPGSVSGVAENRDGTVDRQAGSHPYQYAVSFAFKLTEGGQVQGGRARDVIVDLPPGLVGNPQAVPVCPRIDFDGALPHCPADTQIGVIDIDLPSAGLVVGPVYNLEAPPGVAGQLAFSAADYNALEDAFVRSEEGYGLRVGTFDVPTEILSITEVIWGTPADPSHDFQRALLSGGTESVASSAALQPYLTLPTSCQETPEITIRADSTLSPGVFDEQSALTLDAGGNPAPMVGCSRVPFSPEVGVTLTSRSAQSATGLTFDLALPNTGLLIPGGILESEPRKTVVKLPEGVTVNPSMAVGIDVCTPGEYASEQIGTKPGEGCPQASKIGDVIAHSPLIEEPIEGAIYLASPYQNPFKSLVAGYLVARARDRGVLVKQAGEIELDPSTGQITGTFDGLPPLPYSSFEVKFREGTRAPLVNPPTCGTYQTQVTLTPFSVENDTEATRRTSNVQVDSGLGGGACPSGGMPPFAPSLVTGTLNNAAGHYSPLYVRIERKDGEQEITGFSTQLPPGLSGNLSGIPFCGDAAIQRAREQTGAEAQSNPACPAGSLIGHTIAEAGVGPVLAQTPGNLYLSGPFDGAPFSVVSVTAAKVGPFDLGTVAVHLPLNIDPITAQVSIPSGPADQIPHIIDGVVIHLRAIRVYVDRQSFTLNPTSCPVKSITDVVNGAGQNVASPADDTTAANSSRFQAADCASLAFKPAFKVSTSGKTSRANGASLHVELAYPKDAFGKDANIRSVKVDLPKQLPSRLTTLQKACVDSVFNTNPAACPAASRVGMAKAVTPILPVPIEGPAYFVSHGGAKFPELIIVLQGYGVTIDLHGETFINRAGITSSTFRSVPDEPVTSFELTLPQGPDSALAANGNLCSVTRTVLVKRRVKVRSKGHARTVTRKVRKRVAGSLIMPTAFTAQNGMVIHQNTPIEVTGCARHKAKKTKAGRRGRHRSGKTRKGK